MALCAEHEPSTWIGARAESAKKIHLVTHIIKGIHSGAEGTNICATPEELPECEELTTRALGKEIVCDVSANAADLGAYSFLRLNIGGCSLLEALQSGDPAVLAALDEDEGKALGLKDAFLSLLQKRKAQAASHTYGKQLYWLVDEDCAEDSSYQILAPLYPTSLVHTVFEKIQDDYYGEASKSAREAHRNSKYHEGVVRIYPDLAVRKIGGSNPQNVSQLSTKNKGWRYLLSSAPPRWKPNEPRVLYRCETVFDRVYGGRPEVWKVVSDLLNFLLENPSQKWEVRRQRESYVSSLIGELIQMAASYQQGLLPGWSREDQVELKEDECLWLDPYRARLREEAEFRQNWLAMKWVDQIGRHFARWLNAQLEDNLPVGDVEYRQWKRELLQMDIAGSWARKLYKELTSM